MQLNQNKLPILKVCHTLLIQWNGITSKLVIRCWINQNGMTCFCFAEEFNPGLIRPVRHTFQLFSSSSSQTCSAEVAGRLTQLKQQAHLQSGAAVLLKPSGAVLWAEYLVKLTQCAWLGLFFWPFGPKRQPWQHVRTQALCFHFFPNRGPRGQLGVAIAF